MTKLLHPLHALMTMFLLAQDEFSEFSGDSLKMRFREGNEARSEVEIDSSGMQSTTESVPWDHHVVAKSDATDVSNPASAKWFEV
jgi:hypothetical protein